MMDSKAMFIAEVRKRLAKKRKLKMKNSLMVTNKIQMPLEKIQYHRHSLLLSYHDFKNNQKYIENFIKEKSYKSIFHKIKNTIEKEKFLISNNNKNNISNLFKSKNNCHSCSNLNVKKINLNTPKKTPFQITTFKKQYIKEYLDNSRKKNISSEMNDESKIKSFSINKYNEKKKVFGKTKIINKIFLKKNKVITSDNNNLINRHQSYSNFKIKYEIIRNPHEIQKKNKKANKSLKILKPNCYFNKLNLDKIRKKITSYEY